MTNIPPNPPSPSRPLERDEWIAIFVALATLGSIFFWAMGKTDNGFNLLSRPMLLAPTSETNATTAGSDIPAGESILSLGTSPLNNNSGDSGLNFDQVFPSFEKLGASLATLTPINETVEELEPNISGFGSTKTETEATPKLAKPPKINNQETVPPDAKLFAALGIGQALSEFLVTTPPETAESSIVTDAPPVAPPIDNPTESTPETAESAEAKTPEIAKSPKSETPETAESATKTPLVGAAAPSPEILPPEKIKFSDVPDGFWASSFIQPLAQQDIIARLENNKFEPDKPVTRAEFATQIPKVFEDKSTEKVVNYEDVPSNYSAQSEIQTATKYGFLNGYPGNIFRPEQQMPRLQVLVALASGLNLKTPSNPDRVLSVYKDKEKIPDWAQEKVAAATAAGLVINHPDVKTLNPDQPATRAEVAAMFYQALVELKKVDQVSSEYIVNPQNQN